MASIENLKLIFQRRPRNRAIVAYTSYGRVPNLIDTHTFPYYLAGAKNLVGPEGVFAEELSLKAYIPFFREMYDTTPQGFYYRAETQKELNALAKEVQSKYGKVNGLAEYISKLAQRKDVAERARVLYMNPRSREIKATRIRSGDHAQVKIGGTYLLLNLFRRIPLLDVHTHPVDALFSPSDYLFLISGVSEAPLVRAALVLCPNIQILAVSTAKTPFLKVSEAERLVADFTEGIYGSDKGRLETLERRANSVRQNRLNKINENFGKSLRQLEQAEREKRTGRISEEEFQIKMDETKNAIRPDDAYEQKFDRVLGRVKNKLEIEEAGALNRGLMFIPRLLNIKLYSSTNLEDFYSFTA